MIKACSELAALAHVLRAPTPGNSRPRWAESADAPDFEPLLFWEDETRYCATLFQEPIRNLSLSEVQDAHNAPGPPFLNLTDAGFWPVVTLRQRQSVQSRSSAKGKPARSPGHSVAGRPVARVSGQS